MPGEPVETMVGVGLMGFGTILAYAAYKGINPMEIIRQFIETGKFVDPNKLPKILGSVGADNVTKAALEGTVVASIEKKDKAFSKQVQKALEAYFSNPNSSTQAALVTIIAQMRAKGFTSEASQVETWLQANPPTAATGSTTAVPATAPLDVPSGSDFGTTSAVGTLVFDPSTGDWISPI